MPYVDPVIKEYYEPLLSILHKNAIGGPGEINFLCTEIIKQYLVTHSHNYQTINDIVGALEGAKAEFYRRVASPYENIKCLENGDVYDGV